MEGESMSSIWASVGLWLRLADWLWLGLLDWLALCDWLGLGDDEDDVAEDRPQRHTITVKRTITVGIVANAISVSL